MNADLIRRVAADTAALPNREAWQRIEALLASAGAPRRDWMRLRTQIWAERTRKKNDKK